VITNFLLDHAAAVPVALLLIALACVAAGYLVLRWGRRRAGWVLVGLSLLPVVALTLVPATGGGAGAVGCTVQFALPTWGSVELLANAALFVPPVFFATLVTRRPLAVLVAGSGLSVLVEAVQALAPAIGRACDTNDWMMNTLGAGVGVLLAVGTVALGTAGDRAEPGRGPRR
jgi:hypothetical protein